MTTTNAAISDDAAGGEGVVMHFHAKDGWFFGRNVDGSVTVTLDSAAIAGERGVLGRITFDAGMWQSIIASVSAEGEDNYRFFVAEKFHNGGMKRCVHILRGDFVGAGNPCGLFFDVHHMLDHDHGFMPPNEPVVEHNRC